MLRIGSFIVVVAAFGLTASGCPDINVVDNNTQDGSVNDLGGSDADGSSDTGGAKDCTFGNDAPCDDGNPCTTNKCSLAGKCEVSEADNVCKIGGTCFAAGTIKSDNLCLECDPTANGTDWSDVDCDDGNACTSDDCDFKTGCENDPDDTATCDDGDPCSTDDHCESGTCVGTCETECEVDGDCEGDAGQCHKLACQSGTCVAVSDPDANGTTCDDGDPCTESDVCQDATCAGTPKDCESSVTDPCLVGVCGSGGECETTPAEDGTSCGEPGLCTEMVCSSGACTEEVQVGQDCDTGDACLEDQTCQSDGTCGGGTNSCTCTVDGDCDDNKACTTNTCGGDGYCTFPLIAGGCLIGGQCYTAGQPVGGDLCMVCQPSLSTSAASPLACNDSTSCTNDSCDPATGCVNEPNVGAGCNDGDACTINDACDDNGECTGQANTCDDDEPCTQDSCNAATGGCTHLFQAGMPCEDGDACTQGDTCVEGTGCVGPTVACDDGLVCTTDSCDPDLGCVYEPLPVDTSCLDDDPCLSGACQADGSCEISVDPVCIAPPDYYTSFECGTSEFMTINHFNETGWYVDDMPGPGFYNQPCSLNFNDPTSVAGGPPSYGTANEARAGGTATSPWIQADGPTWVFFYQYWDTQEYPSNGWERRGMRVSTDNFVTYEEYDVGHVYPPGATNQSTWFPTQIDISSYVAGQPFQVQFWFDTIDGVSNNGAGWFIDDFQITPDPQLPPEVCGDQADNDQDGLYDCDDPDCVADCYPEGASCETANVYGALGFPTEILSSSEGMGDLHSQPPNPFVGGGQGGGASDVAYSFTATNTETLLVTLNSTTGWSPVVYALSDCSGSASSLVGFAHDKPAPETAIMYMAIEAGKEYIIIVDGDGGGQEGGFQLIIDNGGEQDCSDGADDDGNGTSDCGDIACLLSAPCRPEIACGDGIDNDGNGLTDCADSNCEPGPIACPFK